MHGVVSYIICDDDEQDPSLRGGQGQVLKVYCDGSDGTGGRKRVRDFAVKRPVDPARMRGLAREAQVYFNIDPSEAEHLAFLSDVLNHKGVPLLVMEWADKGSVKDWLKKQPKQPLPQMAKPLLIRALGYCIQIARGLVSLHEILKMVHHDLKPGTVT